MFVITSPGIDRIENKVLSSSEGPATFANNLSPKITSSDKTPSLTNAHAFAPGLLTSAGAAGNFNFAELL